MPLDGEPAEVVARIKSFNTWLAASPEVPKLLMTFNPGQDTMLTPPMIAWFRENFASLEVVHHPVPAGHHTPEDQPELIAKTLAAWLPQVTSP
jgi:haloalkane dehalogenase